MIFLAKIISIILFILVASKTYLDYKKKKETLGMFLFWVIAWAIIAVFALKPVLFIELNSQFGNQNTGIGTYLGIAFVFLFFITYRVYVKSHRLERQLRDLVMKLGLRDVEE
ncbi:MAG: DUF2304 family protein [bacterium]|nr:DUF2304 family protein [bacterium]